MADTSFGCEAEVALNLCGCGGGGGEQNRVKQNKQLEPFGTPDIIINHSAALAVVRTPNTALLLLLQLC